MEIAPPIEVEKQYNVSIEKLWDFVTNQEYLTKWLMPGDFKPEVGRAYEFDCGPSDDGCTTNLVFGEVLEVNAPHQIRFSWKNDQMESSTIVTFKLESTDAGALLKIEHEGFNQVDSDQHQSHSGGWVHHLNQLENTLLNGN